MASNAPASCCYQGAKHEGQPVGSISKVKDFEVYTSYPENKSTEYAVLMYVAIISNQIIGSYYVSDMFSFLAITDLMLFSLTDVIGHKFQNAQLLADQFAANGYFAFMPDLFYGDPTPLNRPDDFDFPKWLDAHRVDKVEPIVDASIAELREKYNVKVPF